MQPSFVALALLATAVAFAQPSNLAGRRADINYIGQTLPRAAPYFFVHLDPQAYQLAVERLESRIATASDAEFTVGLAQLVAMAQDAHTELNLLIPPYYPFEFRWLDDGVFVIAAGRGDEAVVGSRLVAISGVPIDQVIERLTTVISHEHELGARSKAQQYLRTGIVLEGLDIVPSGTAAEFVFRTLADDEITLRALPPRALEMGQASPNPFLGALPDYLQQRNLNYWYSYSPANRLLYFKYNACGEMPSLPFSGFAAGLLKTMDAVVVDTMVFDFRGNGGGNNMIWKPLLDGFQQRLPRLLSNADFRTYVVLDKNSFSAAVDNPMKLKSPALAPDWNLDNVIRTIGEVPGQSPEMYGNLVYFTASGATGWYPTTKFPRPAWIPAGNQWLPDIPVPANSTDYFARFDPVMAAMLARADGRPAPATGDVLLRHGASLRADHPLAPASFATAFGSFPAAPDEVLLSGTAAPILYSSRSQVNVLVPDMISPGRATVSIRARGTELASGSASIADPSPGIFVSNPGDPSQPGVVFNENGSANTNSEPATSGSTVQVFATGLGTADPSSARVYVGDSPAEVLSSENASGLWRVKVRVPSDASGQVPLFVTVGHTYSNAVTISVRQ